MNPTRRQDPTLCIVHCIDAEGPLEEPVEATFERLRQEFGIDLEPSCATLQALQRQALDLGGREPEVADYLAPQRLQYLSTWREVEEMLCAATSAEFRRARPDSFGNPYLYSWFVIDVVGYADNPRRKAVGFHAVWDRYARLLARSPFDDALGWHFHVVPVGNHALEYNTCWTNNDWHEQAVARRLIERGWFPSLWRAGGVVQRIDQSFWLEQFVPFDYSSQALSCPCGGPGEQSDWRGAPLSWLPYHPDLYDYRSPGGMRRWIFRCLDVDTHVCSLGEADVELAFDQAEETGVAVLAFTCHDRRDIRPAVDRAWELIRAVGGRRPEVRLLHANAATAARLACGLADQPPPSFRLTREGALVRIESDRPLFGPHPFLAVQEEGGVFYRDNPTMESPRQWAYRLARPARTLRIGVGGCGPEGRAGTAVMDISRGEA
jgi:hypothetical protein